MSHERQLHELIGEIYEAATEQTLWPSVAQKFAAMLHGPVGNLFVAERGDLLFHVMEGCDLYQATLFRDTFATKNDWVKGFQRIRGRRAMTGSMVMSLRELKRTEFFNEVLLPSNIAYTCGTIAFNDEKSLGVLAVGRPLNYEDFDVDELRIAETLAPHLRRAILIASRLGAAETRATQLEATLEHLRYGIVLLDQDGQVLFLNRAAERIARAQDAVTVRHRRLRGVTSTGSSALSRLLADAVGAARRSPPVGGALAVPRRSGNRPLQVLAAPLSRCRPSFSIEPRAMAIVLLIDPDREVTTSEDALRCMYRLTRAEAKLVRALADGQRLEGYCEQAGISSNTAKTHLKSVFIKTDTDRQPELLRVVAGLLRDLSY
jgi:DNA-binding CsgD family transcriptional regulator